MKPKKPELRLLKTDTGDLPVSGATLIDVARVAGVSPITVSRALNQPQLVRPNTLAKVQAAIEETGYIKNMLAGALAMSRSKLVSVVMPNVANPIFADMVQAASDTLTDAGYQVLLGLSGYETWREELLVETILSRRPDGVILTGTLHTDSTRHRLQKSGIPVVETWDMTPAPIDMVIGFSHEEVGRAVAGHLIERGYRRIAILSMDDGRAARRRQGLQVALAKQGLSVVASEIMPGAATLQRGREGTARLLAARPDIDVIVASSDTLAHGVLIEAAARGLQVPQQLAVIGFGDQNFAAHVHPALSTVRVDGEMIGTLAAKAILQRLNPQSDTKVAAVTDTGFQLVHRAST
ncbi:LacI family DNA-binding transcriptional regulator [Pseudoduganella sp. UC29_106]|uniref:LacI family DNA-binding transcriptional regulator n=1 Tax=Pseudoduganella sp. UC29_106 TaxID=3374553 RepID=UPI0037574E84